MNLRDNIREYPNFPKKGVLFRDFGPMLRNPSAVSAMTDEFARHFRARDVDLFVGIESRGFVLASLLAVRYGKGMVMIRKAGKLPGEKVRTTYTIEYGKDTIEIQKDALDGGQKRVLICDDLLATGGTAAAAAKLVEKIGGTVAGFAFIIELTGLNGAKKIGKYPYKSLVRY